MTTPSTDTGTDLLTGAAHSPGCEHPQHTTRPAGHADGDEHYVRFLPTCQHVTAQVKVVCGKFLRFVNERGTHCPHCFTQFTADDCIIDLGPVAGFF